jgi:hypothetical protein
LGPGICGFEGAAGGCCGDDFLPFAVLGMDAAGDTLAGIGGVLDFFTTGTTDFFSNFRFEGSRLGAAGFRAARGFLDFAVVLGGRGVVDFFLIDVDEVLTASFLF